ncbi:MAG TPA: hypothetical protein VKD72_18470 [Gemmataceae bacterium]|nr:hypothetical protein [Gemmataceae bacterium]
MDAALVGEVAQELREFAKAGLRDDSARRRLRLLERSPILRRLTPVQVAGGDSKAQYEYLIQAIIDAVDIIGRATSPAPVPAAQAGSESAREAHALRALFGLTGRTRGRTWRVRQEQAALALNISWEYFRHDFQEELLRSVAEQILNAVPGSRPPSMFEGDPGIWAFATQNGVEAQTIEYIRRERPQRATMLEFSTATTGSILRALREIGAAIYLLAANPERVTGWHEARMRRSLTDLLHIDLRDYDKLRMRLYSVPAALRGRCVGDLIILGWYTHRDNKRIDAFDPSSVEVWGHDNAIVAGRITQPHGAVLSTWFEREFERLWTHRSTMDETTTARILDLPD